MQKQLTQEQLTQHLGRIGSIIGIALVLMIAYLVMMLLVAAIILVNLVQ